MFLRRLVPCVAPQVGCATVALSSSSAVRVCVAAAASSPLTQCTRNFNVRDHEREKRRLRELERAGVDPNDDAPWIAPEEEQRLAEEDEQRKAEQAEALKKILAEREKQDAERKTRMKEFRAKQIAMSKKRKDDAAKKSAESLNDQPAASATGNSEEVDGDEDITSLKK